MDEVTLRSTGITDFFKFLDLFLNFCFMDMCWSLDISGVDLRRCGMSTYKTTLQVTVCKKQTILCQSMTYNSFYQTNPNKILPFRNFKGKKDIF